MRLGLREANQRFSAAMRAVRAGEEVIITDRGRPFARIVPHRDESGLSRLIERGVLHPPTLTGPLPPFDPVRLTGSRTAADFLEADREP